MGFFRPKPATPDVALPVVTCPDLDAMRERLSDLITDADQRVDAMLERLRAREAHQKKEPKKGGELP